MLKTVATNLFNALKEKSEIVRDAGVFIFLLFRRRVETSVGGFLSVAVAVS